MASAPQPQIVTRGASPEEAAAAVAAIERFRRDTAPVALPAGAPEPGPWKRAALAEAVARQPDLSL
ncbi:MAG: hypothetical protein ACRDLT_07835 [Solirubrobacteraceae bacterium]